MQDFITQIKIKKVRHLTDITIDIDKNKKKHLILTGKNGSGKTSVLERISKQLQIIEDEDMQHILLKWPDLFEICATENFELLDEICKDKYFANNMNMFKKAIDRYYDGIEVYPLLYKRIFDKYNEGEFILAYFNATRNTKFSIPNAINRIELEEKYDINDQPGSIFLDYLVYLKTQQSFARNEEDLEEVERIQRWFDQFENALRQLFEDESICLKFNYKELNFTIQQDGREPYGFNALSDGYSAALDIVINLILRMEKHHKQAYDIEGIVMIDELENHLHIGLQKKILPFLTSFFPNVQFIITTHSPFIINSVDNAVIFDLEKQQRVEDLSGLAYEGVVEGYFDINQYSKKVEDKLNKYRELIEKEDLTNEESEEVVDLRRYLKGISPELSPQVALDFNQLELIRKSKLKRTN